MKSSRDLNTPQSAPKLQAPGAGLPLIQRLAINLWFGPVISKRTSLTRCREEYERLTQKLIERIEKVPAKKRTEKILVSPIAGLEDSSRFWSLNEVLEHMLIVSKGIESIILELSSGKVPAHSVDVAKVKPGGKSENPLGEFVKYAPELMKRIDEHISHQGSHFDSTLRFRHPWFGEITARQWYWVLKSHQGIHFNQAKQIIKKLNC